MGNIKAICLCILYISIMSLTAQAQHKFSVTMKFPESVKSSQLRVFYDDGTNDNIPVEDTLVQNQLHFSRNYISQFATLTIVFGQSSFKFWLTEKPALIRFEKDSPGLKIVESSEVIDIDKLEISEEINRFASIERINIEDFKAKNKTWYAQDSLVRVYLELAKKLVAKRVDFVKKHPDSYYTFWLFRRELVYQDYDINDLNTIYEQAFSKAWKSSPEGAEIRLRLTGRAVSKGKKSIDFTTTDINKRKVRLQDYSGKNVLVTFWASWCGPCVAEFPKLKELRNMYSADSLAFIFISLDVDQQKFNDALKKYDLPGVQIRNDIEILKKYGVLGIPQVYLIDNKGYVAYSRADQPDINLDYLTKVLAENIKPVK